MINIEIKEESAGIFQFLIANLSIIKEIKLNSIEDSLPDEFFINGELIKKDTEDYKFLQKILKNYKKSIVESDFPEKIKNIWLDFLRYKNINLENYLKIIEILKKEPFLWEKSYFDYNFSKINKENFLDEIEEIHFEIIDKMYEELYGKD